MNKNLLLAFCCLLTTISNAQNEFEEHPNGLMYDEETMTHLTFISDSLNLQFQTCTDVPAFTSFPQGEGNMIRLDIEHQEEAIKAIENNISLEDFRLQFPSAKIGPKELIVRYNYINYQGIETLTYMSIPSFTKLSDMELSPPKVMNHTNWVFKKEQTYSFRALFMSAPFVQQELPMVQASQVQYGECLIDPHSKVMIENPERCADGFALPSFVKLNKFLYKKAGAPKDFGADWEPTYYWKSALKDSFDSLLQANRELPNLIKNAASETIQVECENYLLEDFCYLAGYTELALELKRRRIVYGQCSMDASPRIHAMEIARLSAQSHNWDVFIRSHLDIMNDNFSRMSDGSYALGARKTYFRELEQLNINTIDLILGITYRVQEIDNNHYLGNISRLGRAIAEAEDGVGFELALSNAIINEDLDLYNRMNAFYLFQHYNYHLTNEQRRLENIDHLKTLIQSFPEYLSSLIDVEGFYQ